MFLFERGPARWRHTPIPAVLALRFSPRETNSSCLREPAGSKEKSGETGEENGAVEASTAGGIKTNKKPTSPPSQPGETVKTTRTEQLAWNKTFFFHFLVPHHGTESHVFKKKNMDTLFSCVCLGLLLLCTGVCAQIPTGKTGPGMVKDDVLMWNASYCVDWEVNLFICVCVTECIGSSAEAVSVTFLTGTFRCSTGKVRRRVRTALTVRSWIDLGV